MHCIDLSINFSIEPCIDLSPSNALINLNRALSLFFNQIMGWVVLNVGPFSQYCWIGAFLRKTNVTLRVTFCRVLIVVCKGAPFQCAVLFENRSLQRVLAFILEPNMSSGGLKAMPRRARVGGVGMAADLGRAFLSSTSTCY